MNLKNRLKLILLIMVLSLASGVQAIETTEFLADIADKCVNEPTDYEFRACLVRNVDTTEWNSAILTVNKTLSWLATVETYVMNDKRGLTKETYRSALIKASDFATSLYFMNTIDEIAAKWFNKWEPFDDPMIELSYPTWLIYSVNACKASYTNMYEFDIEDSQNDVRNYAKCLAMHTKNNQDSYTFKNAKLPLGVVQFLGNNYSPGKIGKGNNIKTDFYERMVERSTMKFGD